MKRFVILLAAIAMIGFMSAESNAQCYRGGSGFGISVGSFGGGYGGGFGGFNRGYGGGFVSPVYSRGFGGYGGYGGGYGGGFYRAPISYARPVYSYGGGFGRSYYGGGFGGRGCGY